MAGTSSSSQEVGTSSPSDDFDLRNLASCNSIPCLEVSNAPLEIQIIMEFLCNHDLNIPLTRQAGVPISLIQRAYHTAHYLKMEDCVEFDVDEKNSMKLDKSKFLVAIGFPNLPKEERDIKEPTNDELFDMLEKMNYLGGRPQKITDFVKGKLPAVWQYLCHILLRCLSGKTAASHHLNRGDLCILYGLYYNKDVDIGDILWKDFVAYIEPKKLEIPFGRFWGLILKLCYKELNLEMPKGAFFQFIKRISVRDQYSFGVVNPIPEEMLKYIPTTSTVLSSYLKAMGQSKPAEIAVTGTLKRKHEPSHNSPVKRPTKKPTPPTPSQQGHVRGRKAAEDSLKLIEEERQKKLEQEEIERKSFEESEKKKKTDEGQGDTFEDVLEVNFGEGGKLVTFEDDSSHSGFTLFTKIDDENNIFLADSSAENAKRSEEIRASQGTSESLSKSRKSSRRRHKRGAKNVSKKKFKQMEKTLNEVLEFVRHIPTAADVYTPRADFTKLLDTVTSLSRTVEDMNARQKKLHDEMSTTVAKEAMLVIDKLNTMVNAVNNWKILYDSSLNSLGKTHGEEINRFSTQNSELRKQNMVLHSVVVKLLKSLEILAKPPPQPSEVLYILKSMQTTVEDLPKRLSSEPLKKHFDEAFAKLSALMTDPKVFGQEKGGEEGLSLISKEPTATPLTIPGSPIFGEEVVEIVVEKVHNLPPQQIEGPEVTHNTEKPESSPKEMSKAQENVNREIVELYQHFYDAQMNPEKLFHIEDV